MSNVSDRHSVVPFKAGETKPLSGQRLAKVGYKSTVKNKAKYPSIAVSVPHINPQDITENVQRLLPYIGTILESAQDGIIRSLYESSDGTLQSVSEGELNINACIAFMEAEKEGGRLTKEFLVSWFNANVHDNLYVAVAEKMGFNEPTEAQDAQIAKNVSVYRDLVSALSGGATFYTPVQIAAVRRAMEIASVEDDVSKKLEARLAKMETPVKVEELLEL